MEDLLSPDLPALCPYFTDEMILENERITKKRKGVQLPESNIEAAVSLGGINSLQEMNTGILVCDVVPLLSKNKVF